MPKSTYIWCKRRHAVLDYSLLPFEGVCFSVPDSGLHSLHPAKCRIHDGLKLIWLRHELSSEQAETKSK